MDTVKYVKRAKKGDAEAFIALIESYEEILFKSAKRMGLADEDIADIMQDTILKAFEKLHTLRKEEYFYTWLYQILLNTCRTFFATRYKYQIAEPAQIDAMSFKESTNFEINDALDSLPEKARITMSLYYVAGLTTKEISEHLQEPEGTIKARISRSKQMLKEGYYRDREVLI